MIIQKESFTSTHPIPVRIHEQEIRPFLNHRITIGKNTPQTFLVRQVVREILKELQKTDLNDRCEIAFAGTYLQNLLVEPCSYNDADLKITLTGNPDEDLSTLVPKVEEVVLKALKSLLKQEDRTWRIRQLIDSCIQPFFFGTHGLGSYSLKAALDAEEKELKLEIPITAARDSSIPKYVLNSDSFYIPFQLINEKLGSKDPEGKEEAGKFWMYSYEGDCSQVLNNVKKGIITSSNSETIGRDGWFRVLKDITLQGRVVLSKVTYKNFHDKEVLSNLDDFNNRKHLGNHYLFFLANAIFYNPVFIKEFRLELTKKAKEPNQAKWIYSLQEILHSAEIAQVPSLLKTLLPLFASDFSIKNHLEEKHLRCTFEIEGKSSYVLIPEWNEHDWQTLHSFLPVIQDQIPHSLMLPNLKTFPTELIDPIHDFIESLASRHSKSLPFFLDLLQKCVPLVSPKLSLGAIKRVLDPYKGKLEEIPPPLWRSLERLISISNKTPWQNLFIHILAEFPKEPSLELQSFFDVLFEKLYLENLDFFAYKATEESIEKVQRCFRKSQITNPFRFSKNLETLLQNGKVQQALNLLHYQGGLSGFLAIQPECQKLFYQGISEKAQSAYQEVLTQVLLQEKETLTGLKIAINAYNDLYRISEVATSIENLWFFNADIEQSLLPILKSSEPLKKSFQNAITFRITEELAKNELNPELTCHLLKILSALTKAPISEYLNLLLKKSGAISTIHKHFPLFWIDDLKSFKDVKYKLDLIANLSNLDLSEDLKLECLRCLMKITESNDFELKPLAEILLEGISPRRKLLFAKECLEAPVSNSSENLFELSIPKGPELRDAFKGTFGDLASIDRFYDLLKKREFDLKSVADILFSKIEEKDYLSPAGILLIDKLLPFLETESKEKCFKQFIQKIHAIMNLPKKKQELHLCLSLVLSQEMVPFFERKDLKFYSKIEEVKTRCFSEIPQKLERFDLLSEKKRKDKESESELQFLELLFKQPHLLVINEKDKEPLLRKYSVLPKNSISCSFLKLLLQDMENFSFLSHWQEKEIKEVFARLHQQEKISELNKQHYVRCAFDLLEDSALNFPKEMIPYLPQNKQATFISTLKKEMDAIDSSEIEKIEKDLSCITHFDPFIFSDNPGLYSAFLNVFSFYIETNHYPENIDINLIKSSGALMKDGSIYILEKDKRKYQKLLFYYSDLVKQDSELVFEAMRDWSFEELQKLRDKISIRDSTRMLFLRSLMSKLQFTGPSPKELHLLTNELEWATFYLKNKTLKRESTTEFISFANFLIRSYQPFSQETLTTSDLYLSLLTCAINLIYLFQDNKTSQKSKQAVSQLIKHIGCPHLQRSFKGIVNPLSHTNDRFLLRRYLDFLKDAPLESNETLEGYINRNGLFLIPGNFTDLIRLQDDQKAISLFKDLEGLTLFDRNRLLDNFHLFDLFQTEIHASSPLAKIISAFTLNVYSARSLNELNEKMELFFNFIESCNLDSLPYSSFGMTLQKFLDSPDPLPFEQIKDENFYLTNPNFWDDFWVKLLNKCSEELKKIKIETEIQENTYQEMFKILFFEFMRSDPFNSRTEDSLKGPSYIDLKDLTEKSLQYIPFGFYIKHIKSYLDTEVRTYFHHLQNFAAENSTPAHLNEEALNEQLTNVTQSALNYLFFLAKLKKDFPQFQLRLKNEIDIVVDHFKNLAKSSFNPREIWIFFKNEIQKRTSTNPEFVVLMDAIQKTT